MGNSDNIIIEVEKALHNDPSYFMNFRAAQTYLYTGIDQLFRDIRDGAKVFFLQPCDFVFVEEVASHKDIYEQYNKKYSKTLGKLTAKKFQEYRTKLKKQAESFLKEKYRNMVYWEIDNKNFTEDSKPESFFGMAIINSKKILVKQHPYFEIFGLRFCLDRSWSQITAQKLEHYINFLKSDVKETNKNKIEDMEFYINKYLEQNIAPLIGLIDFLWKENDLNIFCKTMPSSFSSDSPHLQDLAMQDTNNNSKAYDLARNAIKCKEIDSPNPAEADGNANVFVDSFFKWAAKQDFFQEWFYLTDYFKNLNPAGYNEAINTRSKIMCDYISLENAAQNYEHLGFDAIDILLRGIYSPFCFDIYINVRGNYVRLENFVEKEIGRDFVTGVNRNPLNKFEVEFTNNTDNSKRSLTVKLKDLYVLKSNIENVKGLKNDTGLNPLPCAKGIELNTFLSTHCALIYQVFEQVDYIETRNQYEQKNINLKMGAALIATWYACQEQIKQPSKVDCTEIKTKYCSILDQLTKKFSGHDIASVADFTDWIKDNADKFELINRQSLEGTNWYDYLNKIVEEEGLSKEKRDLSEKNVFIAKIILFIDQSLTTQSFASLITQVNKMPNKNETNLTFEEQQENHFVPLKQAVILPYCTLNNIKEKILVGKLDLYGKLNSPRELANLFYAHYKIGGNVQSNNTLGMSRCNYIKQHVLNRKFWEIDEQKHNKEIKGLTYNNIVDRMWLGNSGTYFKQNNTEHNLGLQFEYKWEALDLYVFKQQMIELHKEVLEKFIENLKYLIDCRHYEAEKLTAIFFPAEDYNLKFVACMNGVLKPDMKPHEQDLLCIEMLKKGNQNGYINMLCNTAIQAKELNCKNLGEAVDYKYYLVDILEYIRWLHKRELFPKELLEIEYFRKLSLTQVENKQEAVFILKKIDKKGKKQRWKCVVSGEQLKSNDAHHPALPYIYYIVKNAGQALETIDIYEKSEGIIFKEEKSRCPPDMRALNYKETIYIGRQKDIEGYQKQLNDGNLSLEEIVNDYRIYIEDEQSKEKESVIKKGKRSDFNIDSGFECHNKKDFQSILLKNLNAITKVLNKIQEEKETWAPYTKDYKNAKENVKKSINRFLQMIKENYPTIDEHFSKHLHYNGTDTSYMYSGKVAWEL